MTILAITEEEEKNLAAHSEHRWADITNFSDDQRRLYCFDCNISFDAGSIELALSEPMESPALFAEKLAQQC
jgi:hypothetical protein